MKQDECTLIFNCGCVFRRAWKAAVVKEVSKKDEVLNCNLKARRPDILGLKNNKSIGMRFNEETY